jgi:hypothetical protein
MAQGYFIGRPMRGDLVPGWIDHYFGTSTTRRTGIRERPAHVQA